MVQPDPSVVFRIQSVNLLTCIELLDRSYSDEKGLMPNIKLRPLKKTAYQYWRFEYEENTSRYIIRNVADSNQCLRYDDSTEIACAGNASDSFGSIVILRRDGEYRLSIVTPSETREFYASRDSDDVQCVVRTSNQDGDEGKWQLVPVAPRPQPVVDDDLGTRRIRSHDGKSLLTMSTGSTSVYVRSQLNQSPYQRWKATMKTPGYTTFQNEGSKLYLGCSVEPAAGVGLVGLDKEYQWFVNALGPGGIAQGFFIPGHDLTMGVADYVVQDKDEVCLIHANVTPSMMWYVERDDPIGKDKIYAKREVQEGKYLLHNLKDNATYMNVFSNPWRLVPGSLATHKFELKYVDDKSARFKLTTVTGALDEQIVAVISDDIVEYIGLNRKGTEFVLLEKDEGDPGYVMCLPDSGRPLRVVSGRTTSDNNRNSVFAVDNQVVGDFIQMWIFVPAT